MLGSANRTQPVLGCIADDYTGATDLAGILARSGYRVALRMGVPQENPADAGLADIEVIALKCRTSPVAEAVTEARAALAWLRRAGAARFFWKYCSTFDSTATGNIGPVAQALMADIGTDQTIYCPAFPENGRSVYMGNLFVGEQPLAESPMKDHPLTPMRDSNLIRLLGSQVTGSVGLANRMCVADGAEALRLRLIELRAQAVQHVVVDAVSDKDLSTIAHTCVDFPLVTGGSALARTLPELYTRAGLLAAQSGTIRRPAPGQGQIVLSGSCSAMTRKQVAAYLPGCDSYRLDPLLLAKNGPEDVCNWLARSDPAAAKIIYATAAPEQVLAAQEALGTENVSALIENTLARLAVDARDMGICRFVVAGGETSGAVVRALGVMRLDVSREIVPGVPWTYCESGGSEIALALKSGNFGTTDFFRIAFEMLEGK